MKKWKNMIDLTKMFGNLYNFKKYELNHLIITSIMGCGKIISSSPVSGSDSFGLKMKVFLMVKLTVSSTTSSSKSYLSFHSLKAGRNSVSYLLSYTIQYIETHSKTKGPTSCSRGLAPSDTSSGLVTLKT